MGLVSSLLTKPTSDAASDATAGSGGASSNGSHPEAAPQQRTCAKCGSSMHTGQDWCLQCGAGARGNLGAGPGWRTAVAILGATTLLVVGAAVAAYAALNKTKHKPVVVALVAKTPAAVTPTPTPTTPGATTPGATPTPGTPTTVKAGAPKIPLQTPTPKSAGGADAEANNALFPPETTKSTKTTTPAESTKTTESSSEPTKSSSESKRSEAETKSTAGAEPPSPILLDTNAASVYNPYSYPASLFGDPSLAIDGEEKTAWSAQVQAAVAPKMAEGLALDLKAPQKLGSATVKSTSVGATVEIYATNASPLPSSISDPSWARLVGLKVLKKKITTLKLKTNGKAYRYILLWLAKGPPSSTASSPGEVAINELELFP